MQISQWWLQFQVKIPTRAVDEFLGDLQASLGAAGIHYWILPISSSGRFGVSG